MPLPSEKFSVVSALVSIVPASKILYATLDAAPSADSSAAVAGALMFVCGVLFFLLPKPQK